MNKTKKIFVTVAILVLLTPPDLARCETIPKTVTQLPSSTPSNYQDIISKAFPGYQILGASEIWLNKNEMGSDLYNKVKDSPGLIVGKFNQDNIEDFVALVRSATTRSDSWTPHDENFDNINAEKYDVYAVNLAVCYGLGSTKYQCTLQPKSFDETVPGIFGEIYLPTSPTLNSTDAIKYVCTSIELSVKSGGMHLYRNDFDREHGDYDDVSWPLFNFNGDYFALSVTKFQDNVQYELVSKLHALNCTGLPEITQSADAMPKSASPLTEYQAAINKAFPDYQILKPSEILLDKHAMGAKLYNEVKASPGLITGKFNDDNIEDFAALIKNPSIKTYKKTPHGEVYEESYKAHLVICYGLGSRQYECSAIPGAFPSMGRTTDWALNKTGPGKYYCASSKEFALSNDSESYVGENENDSPRKIVVKTDAIYFFLTNLAATPIEYHYQTKDVLLKCLETSD